MICHDFTNKHSSCTMSRVQYGRNSQFFTELIGPASHILIPFSVSVRINSLHSFMTHSFYAHEFGSDYHTYYSTHEGLRQQSILRKIMYVLHARCPKLASTIRERGNIVSANKSQAEAVMQAVSENNMLKHTQKHYRRSTRIVSKRRAEQMLIIDR